MTLWLVIRPSTAEASESPDDDLVPRLKGLDRLAHREPRTSGLGLLAPDPDLRPEVRGLRSFRRTSHLHCGDVLDEARPPMTCPPEAAILADLPAMIRVFEKSSPDFQRRLDALCNRSSEQSADIEAGARRTIAKVRAGGDAALRALTAEFDKRQLDAIELPAAEWD